MDATKVELYKLPVYRGGNLKICDKLFVNSYYKMYVENICRKLLRSFFFKMKQF